MYSCALEDGFRFDNTDDNPKARHTKPKFTQGRLEFKLRRGVGGGHPLSAPHCLLLCIIAVCISVLRHSGGAGYEAAARAMVARHCYFTGCR